MKSNKFDVSIVTVTYNERENINLLIDVIENIFQKIKVKGEIIIVDDNSPDGTGKLVIKKNKKYKNINLITRKEKLGIASAYKKGVDNAFGDVIVLMDADFSHPPAVLSQLINYAKQGYICCGSRYLGGTKFSSDFLHVVGTYMLNLWIRLVLKTGIKDNTLGYVSIKRNMLDKILNIGAKAGIKPFDKILYQTPIILLGKSLGFSIKEIKAPYKERSYGISKLDSIKGFKIVFNDILYTLSTKLKLKKLKRL